MTTKTTEAIEFSANDLPLACPTAKAPLWSRHPRVYLDIATSGEAICPYCSAHYVLVGDKPKGH